MKNLFIYLLAASAIFCSCKKDKDENPAPQKPSISIAEIKNVFMRKADVVCAMANPASDSIYARGLIFSLDEDISISDSVIPDYNRADSFTVSLTHLKFHTTYYVAPFFETKTELIIGDSHEFTTKQIVTSVTDNEGNVYKTIKIGDNLWLQSSLKTKKYNNGDPIHEAANANMWISDYPRFCYNYDSATNEEYGLLYNAGAVFNEQSFFPEGWRLPTAEDARTLYDDYYHCDHLKTDNPIWLNYAGTNESNFSAEPSGWRLRDASFEGSPVFTMWLQNGENSYSCLFLERIVDVWGTDKYSGCAIRLIAE